MNNIPELSMEIVALTIIGIISIDRTIISPSFIYEFVSNEMELAQDYTTDFWPNKLPEPWNESLF